jgi:hypothetical protein
VARIRSIKPDFFTSESIGALSLHARLTFAGLWTYVDDKGRAKDNVRAIRGALWPNDEETVNSTDVSHFIDELVEHDMVCRYIHEGSAYLHAINFNKHQTVNKPTASRLPECSIHAEGATPTPPIAHPEDSGTPPVDPPEDSGTTPGILTEEYRGEVEVEGNGKELKNPSSTAAPPDGLPTKRKPRKPPEHPRFAEFWTAYPRKVSIGDARKAFTRVVDSGTDPDVLIAAAIRFRDHCKRIGKPADKTRHAATWINGESWTDDLEAEETPPPRASDGDPPPPRPPRRICPTHYQELPESGICRGCAADALVADHGDEEL